MRWLLLSLLALGCDDSSAGAGDGAFDGGTTDAAADAGAHPDAAAGGDAGIDAPDMLVRPEPGFVEMALSPRRSLYTRDDHPQATAVVFDRYGDEIPGFPLRWDVRPNGGATLDEDHALTFLQEGAGAVRACVAPELCGRVSFFVDDAAPTLEILSPARGEVVTGDDPTIEVRGRTDVDPGVAVFVNDEPVEVTADGHFSFTTRARFGLNRIDAIADDGVRRPPTRVVQDVVWAPALHPVEADHVVLPDPISVRITQRLLDTGEAPPEPVEGVQTVSGIAGLLEAFLARAEPLDVLVDDPLLAEGDPMNLRIEALDLGAPDAELSFTDRGLEVFLRIEDLAISTTGAFGLEGVEIGLDGIIHLDAAAFVSVAIEVDAEGSPVLRVVDASVAIERIAGEMADSTAQAILDTLGSLLRSVLEGFAEDMLDDLVRQQVPDFLEIGLTDALAGLRHIPLDVVEDNPPMDVHVDLRFELDAPESRARDALTLGMRGRVEQRTPADPPHLTPGIPAAGIGEAPAWPAAAGLAFAVRLLTVNALAHEAWRQGLLRLDLTDDIPENFRAVIASARIDGRLPPLVVPTPPGSPYFFELQIGELDLYARAGMANGEDRFVVSLRAGLILEVGDGAIRFDIAETPDVRAFLLEQHGARPVLSAEALAAIIGPLVWPQLRETVGDGLSLGLPEIHIGPDAYADLAPTLQDIFLVPDFPVAPIVRHGWFVLSAGFESRLSVAE